MQSFNMKEWLLSICVVILLTAVISLILPEGRIGAYIKSFFSIIVVLVVVSPIMKIKDLNYNFSDVVNIDNVIYQEDFLRFVNKEKIKSLESDCVKLIDKCGVKNSKVNIDYLVNSEYLYSIEKVKIFLDNAVIKSDKEHINIIEEISNAVAERLNISLESIFVYE